MRLSGKDIKGLPVETRSGRSLGKVAGMIVETEDHRVVQYVVKKAHSLAKILPAEILVNRDQVVSIDAEKMVVEDLAEAQAAEEAEAVPAAAAATGAPSPVTRSAELGGK